MQTKDRLKIYDRVIDRLKGAGAKLTKAEWIEFSETLDSDKENVFLEYVNEHVSRVAPEVFDPMNPADLIGQR